MGVADYARSMLAYTEWANNKVLAAAAELDELEFGRVRDTLVHAVGTQRWWHAKWTHDDAAFRMALAEYYDSVGDSERAAKLAQGVPIRHAQWYADVGALFDASHDALRAFAASLTDDACAASEKWWGTDHELPLAHVIFQVVEHGVQHRSEVAVILTDLGHSPRELDYLNFRFPEFADN